MLRGAVSSFFGFVAVANGVVLHELFKSSEVNKIMEAWSSAAMASGSAHHHHLDTTSSMNAVMSHIDVQSAARMVAHKGLTPDVQSMVQVVAQGGNVAEFSEISLEKARHALNRLIEKAWEEIDDLIMQCKGFEDMNRHTHQQVDLDIRRLVAQISDLERVESEAVEGINIKDQEIRAVEEQLALETTEYNREYAANSAQLRIYQNDMDVFQFIMEFSKCTDDMAEVATSLAQYQVCQTESGNRVLKFDDPEMNAKFEKLMTPHAMQRLDRLLDSMGMSNDTSLLQAEPVKTFANENELDRTPHDGFVRKEPVIEGPTPAEMSKKCKRPPACVHDALSLMWGEHKDKVDSLTMVMMKNQYEFEELKANFNRQIDVLKTAKAKLNQLLAEARANLVEDNGEKQEKEEQKRELDKHYHEYLATHCKFEKYLLICSFVSVRNAVHEGSQVCPPEKMIDCTLGNFVPGECSVSCDDSCKPEEPYKCGGWQQMTREVVQMNTTCGYKCARVVLEKRCGQYPCPVNCDLSEWSEWSGCSADCGGGVRGRTRKIIVKPENGGISCNTLEEQTACATGSCDRPCLLARWTDWTPCSMACNGGFKESFRHVARPTRGFGRCPTAESHYRYRKTSCNTQACRGDEICVAQQDLVVAIDGSNSITEQGFGVLKTYVKKLLSRYQTEYWGAPAVKLGIVLFGNGAIMPDGKTVAPAILSCPLTDVMATVETAVDDLPFKRGFTNMAQAFASAEQAFIIGARRTASSAVLVVTDGKPSFNFMTTEMVEQLDDKAITRYFLLVNEDDLNSESNKLMKSWASQPWETSLIHVPGGTELLESDYDLWVEKSLVTFCPAAYSPSEMEWEEINYGYAHVKDGGYCGDMLDENLLSTNTESAETCAALVSGAGGQSFILGCSWARGKCYMGSMDVSMAQFNTWQKNKAAPSCDSGWKSSTLYDFYAMEPPAEDGTAAAAQ